MKIIVFDTETTGLPNREAKLADQPFVMQFASITYEYNPLTRHWQELSRFDQLIKPPVSIPADCVRITGITDQKVANSPSFQQVSEQIHQLFQEADVAIAHNLEFDRFMLSNEFQRSNLNHDFLPGEIYDSMEGTRNLCKLPGRFSGYKAPKLMELHQFLLNEKFEEAHNAMKDVEALARCVKIILQQGLYIPQLKPRAAQSVKTVKALEQVSLF